MMQQDNYKEAIELAKHKVNETIFWENIFKDWVEISKRFQDFMVDHNFFPELNMEVLNYVDALAALKAALEEKKPK